VEPDHRPHHRTQPTRRLTSIPPATRPEHLISGKAGQTSDSSTPHGADRHDQLQPRSLAQLLRGSRLRAYLAQHETLEDVDGAEIHGFALGHWVKRCRDDYRSGSLNGWQIDDLESLPGWTWRGPDERWRQGIAALRAYYLRHGGAQPPRRAVVNGFAIGAWVQGCRRDYRQGTLSAEHVAELESIPTWAWSVRRRPGKD
jgi:helicase associated protein